LGIKISNTSTLFNKKILMRLAVVINLLILVYYKYLNFLLDSFLYLFNINITSTVTTSVLLPLGLSFYTFQNIGYILDIYRGSQKPERNIFNYALFVIFFPKLLVGPIERAKNLLHQISSNIHFAYSNLIEGSKRIVWGLFKKLVVAERISLYVSVIDAHPEYQSGSTVFIASVLYTFQVYADFSGYADIAIGSAKLFGINLMENFNRPLFAKNLSDFWRRWHISLSSWVNDYIFNPILLNKRKWKVWGVFYALFISFIIIGIWHGASWNYALFGFIQAIILFAELLTKKFRIKISKLVNPFLYNIFSIILTFLTVSFCLIIFRSPSLIKSNNIILSIYNNKGDLYIDRPSTFIFIFIGIILMMISDIGKEFNLTRIQLNNSSNWIVQNISYALLLIYILIAAVFDAGQFIYFSF
jgi:D-alanyl-lipoteichoic acid acyltransferase DltB (MBOAT superfamily)